MSKSITYWVDTPTIQELCAIYGYQWQNMAAEDATGLLAVLGFAAYQLSVSEGDSDPLPELASSEGVELTEAVWPHLERLDKELDAGSLLNLIQGLASVIPASCLEGE